MASERQIAAPVAVGVGEANEVKRLAREGWRFADGAIVTVVRRERERSGGRDGTRRLARGVSRQASSRRSG